MRSKSLETLIFISLGIMFAAHGSVRASMGGEEDAPATYRGEIGHRGGSCQFTIDLERVQFLVTTVANKYRFVRMLVNCQGEEALRLSSSSDRFQADAPHGTVAVLNLQSSDSELWDGLAADIRRMLAYPQQIESNDPVYVFAYLPIDDDTDMPERFSYTIASIGETVHLYLPPPTAARR